MTEAVVLRRARLASGFTWGCLVPFWVLGGLLLLIMVTASNFDARGRVLPAVGLALVVAYLWWFVRRIPRLRETLVLTIDGGRITGTQNDEVLTFDRSEVWFAEISEVYFKGVPYLALYGHDGRLLARWETAWAMGASSWTARRRLTRAGVPWVHLYNGKVWKREGVGAEADAVPRLITITDGEGLPATIPPLELEWGVPPAWFVITLGGDLDAAVTEALDEGARRDPNVMEVYPQLHGMLQRYAADRQGDGAVVVLVRWGQTDDGGLFSAYASVDRLERDAGPVDGEVQERFDQLSEERADDRGAPTVEVFATPVGRGVWREAVGELPAADGGDRTEIVELAVLHDIWLWVVDGPDVLRIGVTSFQLGLADQLRAELGAIVDTLRAR